MGIIRDEIMSPYFIKAEEFNYIVCFDTGRKVLNKRTNEEVPEIENKGYLNTLHAALKKVAKLKAGEIDEQTLNEYVGRYESIGQSLLERLGKVEDHG